MNLEQFGSWALGQGSVANPEPNNKYKGECVSLVQQYLYQVFGKPFKAYGNAKDWIDNYPSEYFNKLNATVGYQKGDVLVYGVDRGNGYGHMGIIDCNNKWLDQNGIKKKAVAYQDKPFAGYKCILRPKNQDALGLEKDKFNVGTVYTTQVELYIRDAAGTDKQIKQVKDITVNAKEHAKFQDSNRNAILNAGTRVTCMDTQKIGNDIWIKIPSGWIAGYYEGKDYVK